MSNETPKRAVPNFGEKTKTAGADAATIAQHTPDTDENTAADAAPEPSEPVKTENAPSTSLKTAQPAPEPNYVADAEAEAAVEPVAENTPTFLSKYHSLTLYVQIAAAPDPVAVQFKNGILRTNEAVARELRKHKRFNKMFRESRDASEAALRKQLAAKQAQLTNATHSGMDTSTNGADNVFNQQMKSLTGAEQKLIDL